MKNNHEIFIKVNNCESSFKDLCHREYMKINNLMRLIEQQFNISLHDYPDLRNEILDISNFINRLPSLNREVLNIDNKK